MKGIKNVCQLVGRGGGWVGGDGHLGDVRRLWGGVTVVRMCGSSKGDVSSIRQVWQLMETCDGHGGM